MELMVIIFGITGFFWYKSHRLKMYIDLCYPDLDNYYDDDSYDDVSSYDSYFVDLSSLQLTEISSYGTPGFERKIFRTIQLIISGEKIKAMLKSETAYVSEYKGWSEIKIVVNGVFVLNEREIGALYGSFVTFSEVDDRAKKMIKGHELKNSLEAFLLLKWKQYSTEYSKYDHSIQLKGAQAYNRVLNSGYYFLRIGK